MVVLVNVPCMGGRRGAGAPLGKIGEKRGVGEGCAMDLLLRRGEGGRGSIGLVGGALCSRRMDVEALFDEELHAPCPRWVLGAGAKS